MITKTDMQGAILIRDCGDSYAVLKEAGPGWRGGYLVISKAGYRKKRRVKHFQHRQNAEAFITRMFEGI